MNLSIVRKSTNTKNGLTYSAINNNNNIINVSRKEKGFFCVDVLLDIEISKNSLVNTKIKLKRNCQNKY